MAPLQVGNAVLGIFQKDKIPYAIGRCQRVAVFLHNGYGSGCWRFLHRFFRLFLIRLKSAGVLKQFIGAGKIELAVFQTTEHIGFYVSCRRIKASVGIGAFCMGIDRHPKLIVGNRVPHSGVDVKVFTQHTHWLKVKALIGKTAFFRLALPVCVYLLWFQLGQELRCIFFS